MKQKSNNQHIRTDRNFKKQHQHQKPKQYRGKNGVSNDAKFKANEALRMISDMSFGKFNRDYREIHELHDKSFLIAGIDAFNDKIETEDIILNALLSTYGGNSNENPKIRLITNKHIRTRQGWLFAKSIFMEILDTGNVEYAIGLNHRIQSDFSYDLKYSN